MRGSEKAVNDSKAAQHQLEELQRHDRVMEQGRGLYLCTNKNCISVCAKKCEQGVAAKKKAKETTKMLSGATTNVQLNALAKRMRVSYFRAFSCVSMSDGRRNESGIMNLDNATGPDIH